MWTRLTAYVRGLASRRRIESEVEEELRFHLEQEIAANVSLGLSQADARRAALRQLSGLTQTREAVRDVRVVWVEQIWQDLKHSARRLRREPGFTASTVLALGIAIGANNTIFTVVNAACLRGLSIAAADRVVFVGSRDERGAEQGVSYFDFKDMQSGSHVFQGLAAHAAAPLAISDEGRAPDRLFANYVTTNLLQILGESLILGRDFQSEDGLPGAAAVAILGGGVWRSRYGSDPSLIGRTVRIDAVPTTVIGVAREGFKLPNNADLWLPLSRLRGLAGQARDVRTLTVLGRLMPDATASQAREQLDALASRLSADHPETNRGIHPVVVPLNDRYNTPIESFLSFIAVGVIIVLIACGNVGSLLLMRAMSRTREIAMRASLGATRWRIVRQLLTESALLSALAGVVGWGLSLAAAHLLWVAIPANATPYWFDYRMDARVLAALAGVCVIAVFIFGLAPALHVAKTDTMEVLKTGGRSGMDGRRSRRWTTVFLAAQFGLSTIFVATLINSERITRAVRGVEYSIDLSPLQTMWVSLSARTYARPIERLAFQRRLLDEIGATPGVLSSTLATALPAGGAVARQMAIAGRSRGQGDTLPTVWTIAVGPKYFNTLGLPLRGHDLAMQARDGVAAVDVVINQRLATVYFPGEDPIGRRVELSGPGIPTIAATIVGVSATFRQRAASGAEPDPLLYLPIGATAPSTVALIIRGEAGAAALAAEVRERVRSLDADLPIYRTMPLVMAMREFQWANRQSAAISYTLIAIAFALAIVGLYAVTAHTVTQRTQELGVRIALGARSGAVVSLVLGRMLRQLALGLVAGIACTFAWERLFSSVSQVPTVAQSLRMTDASVLLVTELAIVLVAVAACLSIALRAARLDPIVALRHE